MQVSCTEFNAGSYRLKKDGFVTIDIYPKGLKFFRHDSQEWGKLENITAFVTFEFGNKAFVKVAPPIDYKAKYEKCIAIIKRFDAGIIGMYDL